MDFLLPLQAILALLLALALFYNPWISKAISKIRKRKEAPQPAGAWPVIGHLFLLSKSKNFTTMLGAMADKYGPAFVLRLGVQRTFIVSSWELAKECFTTNDRALASRPKGAGGKHMGYNYASIPFTPYGPYWREVRKIATVELLSNSRLELLKHVRDTEVNMSTKELYGLWDKNGGGPLKVEMKQWLGELNFNIVVRMVVGKRCFGSGRDESEKEEAQRFLKAMAQMFKLLGTFDVSTFVPFLKWMDSGRHESAMKETAREMDSILETWLKEHRKRRVENKADGNLDFIDVMLSLMDNAVHSAYDPDTTIKATSLALVLGGTETTTASLTWALALLLNNPRVLRKAQEELDSHVGRDRHLEESDIKKLVYLQAIVKETLRLYPAVPLLVPHAAMEDCQVGGFHVAKGTRVMVNVRKIHRDPRVWPEPSEFRPERFLTSGEDVDVRGQHFELLPFGSGRRACPGISFALQVMHLTLARLIHGFELRLPSDAPADMSEGRGASLVKATPLEIMCTPRIPLELL